MECYDKKRFEPPVLKREKKIKALIDKFFPKEYKNTHAHINCRIFQILIK